MAVPTVVGTTPKRETYGTTTVTRIIDVPAGTQVGDLLILVAMHAGNGTATVNATGGWTSLLPMTTVGTRSFQVLWARHTGGSTVSVTIAPTVGGGTTFQLIALRDVDTAAMVAST